MLNNHTNCLRKLKLSAVVPCYNEEQVLRELHNRLSAACRACVGDDYEIIFVNDGSRDATWQIIKSLSQMDSRIVGVNLTRNHGHQLALTAGLSICYGARVLVIDADLQDPPELLRDMMSLADNGADVVYGQRRTRKGETWFKTASAALFGRLLDQMTDVNIPPDTGDFRLMDRRVVESLNTMPEQHRYIRGMVSWLGYRQVPLLYDRDERFAGDSKYTLRKMIKFAMDAITGFSIKPLKLASYLGFVFAIMAVVGIVYTFYSWIFLDTVAGWTSVMTVVLLLGSIQLFVLGIFGEYLGRMFVEIKHRPLFLVDEILGQFHGENREK